MGVLEPRRVGRYDLLLPIASGGMGAVYLARAAGAAGFERDVALKLTHHHLRESATFVADVLAEAQIASRIHHTNVVPVLDVGEDEAGVFLVMEYVAGDSLAGLVKKGREAATPLPARVGLRILVDSLAGLHAAHELVDDDGHPQHVVHRDFSPQNILVGLDGVSRLTDFGIAKAASRASHTLSGVIKGKACYVSPEQAQDRPLDRRCDVWSAGVVAWELLAGRRLYQTDNEAAVLLKIVSETPPRVSTVAEDIPEALDEAVRRALVTDRDERTATAQALAKDLSTAARAFGMLADPEEVAAWVAKLTGPALEKRKQKAHELRRSRGSDPQLFLPTAPASFRPGGAPGAPPSVRESLAPPSSTRTLEEPSTDTSAVADPFTAPRRTNMLALAAGGGAGVSLLILLVVAVTVIATRTSPSKNAAASERPETAPPSVAASPAPAAPTAPAAPAASAAEATPTIEIFEATRDKLEVTASAPLSVVFVDGRTVRVAPPSTSVSVALEGDEQRRPLKISGMTPDGRTANAEITQYSTTVKLAPRPRSAGTKPKLAKNPFEK